MFPVPDHEQATFLAFWQDHRPVAAHAFPPPGHGALADDPSPVSCETGHQWRLTYIDLPAWGYTQECVICGLCRSLML
jgi:hypothetical protein